LSKEIQEQLISIRQSLDEVTTVSRALARSIRDDQVLLSRFDDIFGLILDMEEFLEEAQRNRNISEKGIMFADELLTEIKNFRPRVGRVIASAGRALSTV